MAYSRLSPSKRGYGRDWQALRLRHLASEPLCRMCKAEGRITAATVVDHIVPIEQAPHRRLDASNCQSLCKPHHDSTKQRIEKSGEFGVDAQGRPLDPLHPWSAGRAT